MVAPGGGHAWLLPGGGCVWLLLGGGMRGCSRLPGDVRGCSGGACVVAGGEGHAWDTTRCGDTIKERAVRILLECILFVVIIFV